MFTATSLAPKDVSLPNGFCVISHNLWYQIYLSEARNITDSWGTRAIVWKVFRRGYVENMICSNVYCDLWFGRLWSHRCLAFWDVLLTHKHLHNTPPSNWLNISSECKCGRLKFVLWTLSRAILYCHFGNVVEDTLLTIRTTIMTPTEMTKMRTAWMTRMQTMKMMN